MKLFTIGFTKKSAEEFFTILQNTGVSRIVDVRLNNTSQIAGFAKARDLKYFLHAIVGIDYVHIQDFAPTQDILDDFKKNKGSWAEYERSFVDLMLERRVDEMAAKLLRDRDCLLCSEHTPENCHRRLLAEYLKKNLTNIEVVHL
ncbi:MAG TPA: DUF488 domain-containing protein [Sedimentisphaerales bacterium]|nr:DUF488 domain-containing protein [Sedimentisphaerales bacterium]